MQKISSFRCKSSRTRNDERRNVARQKRRERVLRMWLKRGFSGAWGTGRVHIRRRRKRILVAENSMYGGCCARKRFDWNVGLGGAGKVFNQFTISLFPSFPLAVSMPWSRVQTHCYTRCERKTLFRPPCFRRWNARVSTTSPRIARNEVIFIAGWNNFSNPSFQS